jgi:hypothetical protein
LVVVAKKSPCEEATMHLGINFHQTI